jgi:hypothetical protein
MAASPDDTRATGSQRGTDSPAGKEADHAVAPAKDSAGLSDSDRAVLCSMIDSYERVRADNQRFIERVNDADRTEAIGRPRHRRVRVATSVERRQRASDPF